ncbi:MAG: bifunctional metallophosphatase/5'-nucleotidase [Armatimonadota bacterium]|jgi:2',3'-cyclic-nucleotide 2'-phosphodiesterase/3'-nucleotidase
MRIPLGLALLAAVVVATLSFFWPPAGAAETVTLTILHTTDLHGYVRSHRTDDGQEMGGLDRIGTLIRRERRTDPEAILLDNGDTIQGNSMAFMFKGRHIIEGMNALNYDAMTAGNHEFNFGPRVIERMRQASRFPWLSANVVRASGGEPVFEPFVILERKGVRVGVLGLTVSDVPNWEQPSYIEGLEFVDIIAAAREWVPRVRPLCDVLVLLAHTGAERRENERYPSAAAAGADIARECPGVDVIICGHRHVPVESLEAGGAVLTAAGKWGSHLGKVTLEVEKSPDGVRVVSRKAQLIPVTADVPQDAVLEKVVAPFEQRWKKWAEEVIGETAVPLDFRRAQQEETAAVNLIHDAMKWATGADVTLHVAFNNSTVIPAGPVTNQDVAEMYEYDNALWVLTLTGRQLKDYLEDGIAGYGTWRFLTAAGINYVFDVSRPRGERLVRVDYNGRPLADDAVLTVAINHYNAVRGVEDSLYRKASDVRETGRWIRDVIADYIRAQGTARPAVRGWFTVEGAGVARPAGSAR